MDAWMTRSQAEGCLSQLGGYCRLRSQRQSSMNNLLSSSFVPIEHVLLWSACTRERMQPQGGAGTLGLRSATVKRKERIYSIFIYPPYY